MTNTHGRKVTANLNLTIDGRYTGPDNDFSAFLPYVTSEVARDHMTRLWKEATTAVLGRVNAEGFMGYWSAVATDENADPRDRGYATWLVDTEKVVFSTTLDRAPWERTRVVNAPVEEVLTELKSAGEGDLLINCSVSVIKAALAADLVDRLYLMVFPEIIGAGPRLFEDGLPASNWTLAHQETGKLGEIALTYDRTR